MHVLELYATIFVQAHSHSCRRHAMVRMHDMKLFPAAKWGTGDEFRMWLMLVSVFRLIDCFGRVEKMLQMKVLEQSPSLIVLTDGGISIAPSNPS